MITLNSPVGLTNVTSEKSSDRFEDYIYRFQETRSPHIYAEFKGAESSDKDIPGIYKLVNMRNYGYLLR